MTFSRRWNIPSTATMPWPPGRCRPLTPEEEAIALPADDDEIDDLLPADLWFRRRWRGGQRRR